jgi:hypothetical protein
MNYKQNLKHNIFKIISQAAQELNLECYVIGGFVRDFYLKRDRLGKDYDIDFITKTKKFLLNNSTDLSTTPWTIVDIMHKQIIETTTWLPFALWLIRIFSIWLWVLYGFIWWTQFSRCQHRYQKQTRWLAQLMVSQRTIFSLLTQRLMIANYGFLAIVGILLSIAVAHFQWLVNYSLISLIAFSVMLTGGLIVFSSLLQKIFPYFFKKKI